MLGIGRARSSLAQNFRLAYLDSNLIRVLGRPSTVFTNHARSFSALMRAGRPFLIFFQVKDDFSSRRAVRGLGRVGSTLDSDDEEHRDWMV